MKKVILLVAILIIGCKPPAVKEADQKLEEDQNKVQEFRKTADSTDNSKIRKALLECADKSEIDTQEKRDLRVEISGLREQVKDLKEEIADAQTAIWFYRGFWFVVIGLGILAVVSWLIKIGIIKI